MRTIGHQGGVVGATCCHAGFCWLPRIQSIDLHRTLSCASAVLGRFQGLQANTSGRQVLNAFGGDSGRISDQSCCADSLGHPARAAQNSSASPLPAAICRAVVTIEYGGSGLPFHGQPAARPARSRSVRLELFKQSAGRTQPAADHSGPVWRLVVPGIGECQPQGLLPLCRADERAHLRGTLWHSTELSRPRSPHCQICMHGHTAMADDF